MCVNRVLLLENFKKNIWHVFLGVLQSSRVLLIGIIQCCFEHIFMMHVSRISCEITMVNGTAPR